MSSPAIHGDDNAVGSGVCGNECSSGSMEEYMTKQKAVEQIEHIKKEKFISVYSQDEVRGNVSIACSAIPIARGTFYNWLESDEEFREQIKEAKLKMCDDMEQVLIARAVDKDTTALIFWLKKNHDTYKDTPQLMQQFNVGGKDGNTITFVNFKENDR